MAEDVGDETADVAMPVMEAENREQITLLQSGIKHFVNRHEQGEVMPPEIWRLVTDLGSDLQRWQQAGFLSHSLRVTKLVETYSRD